MKKLFTLVLLTTFFLTHPLVAQTGSTFTFTNTGTDTTMDNAIEYSGQIWGQYLNSAVPIKVNVYYIFLGVGTTLAVTIPNGERDFAGAYIDSVWYPSCLANSIVGSEINPGEADMNIFVNSTVNWYWGTDANCPLGKYDFVSVFLHEIGHGLGFLSLAKMQDTIGSFGQITSADILPLVTDFPFPDLQGKYSVFSSFMENGSGQQLDDTLIFPNPSVALADEFTSNAIYFNAPLSYALNGNAPVRLYAPATYEPGSSMEHLNEATFPVSNPNTMMTPFIGVAQEHHSPGPLTIAILEDIGWNVNHDIGFENITSDLRMEIFPNPVQSQAMLRLDKSVENEKVDIVDMMGKLVYQTTISVEQNTYYPIDLSFLAEGIYTVRIKDGLFKLIKN